MMNESVPTISANPGREVPLHDGRDLRRYQLIALPDRATTDLVTSGLASDMQVDDLPTLEGIVCGVATRPSASTLPETCTETGTGFSVSTLPETRSGTGVHRLRGVPHEMLAPGWVLAEFSATEDMEPTLIRWLHRVVSEQTELEVRLNNFGGRPAGIIHARLQEPGLFEKLVAQLRIISEYIESNGLPPVVFHQRPHFPVAKADDDMHFYNLSMKMGHSELNTSFLLKHLSLVCRSAGEDRFRRIAQLGFRPANLIN